MNDFPERIKRLEVTLSAGGVKTKCGELLRESQYVFRYDEDDDKQPAVSLLMPASTAVYQDGDLFPSMDMNLPEGFLFQRIVETFPKRNLTKMHLLALMGDNAIGRVGFAIPGEPARPVRTHLDRATILQSSPSAEFFRDLVQAYLSTGIGISGVQPKIMVPTKASLPIPDLIVKAAGPSFPGLAANEYLCLSAARRAGIRVPQFELSDDGSILVLDRFDIAQDGTRLGFEDIAALMTLRVHDRLSSRKYHGSYQAIAEVISLMSSDPSRDLAAYFEQLTLSVMVRNGDAHLKNFAMIYDSEENVSLSPLYDVVTTTIYTYERPGGVEDIDRTLALKWRSGRHHDSRAYPSTEELLDFGRQVCRVSRPQGVIERLADAMIETLAAAKRDQRVSTGLLGKMAEQWSFGLSHAGLRKVA